MTHPLQPSRDLETFTHPTIRQIHTSVKKTLHGSGAVLTCGTRWVNMSSLYNINRDGAYDGQPAESRELPGRS